LISGLISGLIAGLISGLISGLIALSVTRLCHVSILVREASLIAARVNRNLSK
jgi:hypothetical protein